MEFEVVPGTYVIAVSGGVDSVVLLDVARKHRDLTLVVAHFDHGIRPDSGEDRKFVQMLAAQYGLPFEYQEGRLGAKASEATARTARYAFLRQVKETYAATAVLTAHHQDDVIETAIINLLRGTGRKGLTALSSSGDIIRPLLACSKRQIQEYAKGEGLQWREDSTNADTTYLRNYVRLDMIPKLGGNQRQEFLRLIESQRSVNAQLDTLLLQQLEPPVDRLQRRWFIALPYAVATETMAAWLRLNHIREFDKATVERAVAGAKTAKPGKKVALKSNWFIEVYKDYLALTRAER